MKVVLFAWGTVLVVGAFACGGKVTKTEPVGGGAAGSGGDGVVACPGPNADLSKLQNQRCQTMYDTCGPGGCSINCGCADLGQGLRWICGSICQD
ncbi:MAG TPA: hypothetical protein VGI10_29530 [Polyangiaceae bacterium]|jgi:hypothetical protein